MKVSVIIPTYNRAEILRSTLQAYLQQSGDHRIHEILIVDDGSADHTGKVVAEAARTCSTVRYLRQNNSGLAAARNHAIREAVGDLLIFGDDDIIPSPQLTAEHVAWHLKNPGENMALLGNVPWLPAVRPTPFMKWSGLYGPQFNFGYFTPGQILEFQFGYFCNTSVHTSFLRKYGVFNESFKTYGYEDVELAYRLSQHGYELHYGPQAFGFHNKFETFDHARRRVEALYRSWPEFVKTPAGEQFLRLWIGQKKAERSGLKGRLKKMIRPLKAAVVPLLRPLVDTYLPLPNWVYERVFYHYVTPFSEVVASTK